MELVFELHDQDGVIHKYFNSEFENQSTLKQLREEIHSMWQIDNKHQELFFEDGRRLSGLGKNKLQSYGLKDGSKVIVKHANLDTWTRFNAFFDLAKKYKSKKQEHKAKENVKYAFDKLTILKKSNFFNTYARFDSSLLEFNENYASFLDTDDEQIKKAAEFYFALFFKDDPQKPSIKTVFSPKPNIGAQGGLICLVKRSDEILGNYYLKTHLGLSSNTPSAHQAVDLRELLIYKVLNLLEMGPVVHFITNVHSSRFGVYIATEEVPGFRTAAKIGMPTLESYKLDILREIFYLIDLRSNNSNYGLNKNDKLCIVDFQIGNHARSTKGSLRSYLNSNDRTEFYKTCMKDWRLSDVVRNADEQISKQKILLNEQSISSKASKNYMDYLQRVSENIQFVSEILQKHR